MDPKKSDPQDQQSTSQQPQETQPDDASQKESVSHQYISGGNKEHAPISQPRETVQVPHTESTPEIADEAREAGVEASHPAEIVKIPDEVKQIGVTQAKESAPVPAEPSGAVTFPTPVPPAQAKVDAKGDPSEAKTWQAALILRVLKKLGIKDATE